MADIGRYSEDKIKIKVKPGAKKTEIIGSEKGFLVIKLKSQAEKGKANEELLKLLRKKYKRRARIIKGEKNREKIIEFF